MMGDNIGALITHFGEQFSIQCPYCGARILRHKSYFSDQQMSNEHQQPCPNCKQNYNVNISECKETLTTDIG